VLLFGPPGTGKTMLAKAVATEGNATFLSVDAGLIHQKYSNESGAFVRAVFRVARRLTPCVIYIDGIDALLDSSNDSTQRSLITATNRTLMQEWDGVRTTADRIFLIASTNRPDALDQAVLRRLPRRILVDLPDAKAREEILRTIMGNNRMAPDVDFSAIAKRMKGYTGSDIRKICREVKARVAHAEARKLEREGKGKVGLEAPGSHRLRAATNDDFDTAMRKLASL
jgi:SpoVK/Ycf46/Vps4 family AAA+-type ATPase